MSPLTGTGGLLRFLLRRDRVRVAVWVAAIVLLVVVTAESTKGLYSTQADLDQAAAVSIDNPAALAFNGPAQALDTMGGQVAFQVGAFGLSVVALMSLLLVNRMTRVEEDSGRLELVRSMAVGRHAPLAAALLLVTGVNVVVGALVAASLVAADLPVAGSIVFGASFTVLGVVFTALAAVTAQVAENPRVAAGTAGAVLGASFVLRAVGDIGDGTVSWLSPIGWAQKARPYAGERWWPFLVALAAAGILTAVAAQLTARRDFGAGLVAPRPGPARGGLGSALDLAARLQRGTVAWWAFALLLTGAAYGSIAEDIGDFVNDNEALEDLLAATGGAGITDSYLGFCLLTLALIAAGFALQAVLRLRSEESELRAEPLLATRTGRLTWVGSHLVLAVGGTLAVLAAGGLGTGVVYAAVAGDAGQVPRLVGAALVHAPAVWLVIGVTVALFGLAPRWAVAGWAVLGAGFVLGMFGPILDAPGWVLDLSPFEHTPLVPAEDLDLLPLAVLTALAAGLTAAGLAGFRRRDVG